MTPSDEAAFCDWAAAQFVDVGMCRYVAVGAALAEPGATLQATRDLCASKEQACLQLAPSSTAATCRDKWLTPSCQATADEMSRCMTRLAQNYDTAFTPVPECSMLELDSAPKPFDVSAALVGCEAVLSKCPTLFGPNGDEPEPNPGTPAVVTSCEAVVAAFEASCGKPSDESCGISRQVFGEECDEQGVRFWDCGKTATFDCNEDDLLSAVQGCNAVRSDYLTCFALEGVTCEREPAIDPQCEDEAGKPFAKRCVTDAVPAECVLALGNYYCCPSE